MKRLKPEGLLRKLRQLLKQVRIEPPGGFFPPDWPSDDSDRWGEDDHHRYYYLFCPEMAGPDMDISLHKGLVLIRIEK